jgi:hypothetical protein
VVAVVADDAGKAEFCSELENGDGEIVRLHAYDDDLALLRRSDISGVTFAVQSV